MRFTFDDSGKLVRKDTRARSTPVKEGSFRSSVFSFNDSTGVRVTPDTALTLGAVWACVRAVTETIASLPLNVMQRTETGARRVWEGHPLQSLLHRFPNPLMSKVEFWEYMIGHLELRGNAYAEIERDRMGRPVALWVLHPDAMTVVQGKDGIEYGYRLNPGGETVRLRREQILHIKFLSLDGVLGLSPIKYAASTVGAGIAAREYSSRVFRGDGMKRMALVTDMPLKSEQVAEISAAWRNAYSGLDSAHRVAVLHSGLKPETIGISPEDAQLLQLWNANVNDVCRIWRVPPHKIAQLDRATFSNIEEQNIEWVTDSILPRVTRIEAALDSAFFRDDPQGFTKFNIDGLLRGRLSERMQAYATSIQWGFRSRNEIRALEELEPFAGGDNFDRPLNMLPIPNANGGASQ